MSRPELMALLADLAGTIADLRDAQWSSETPQHFVANAGRHIDKIEEAAAELRRLHGVKS